MDSLYRKTIVSKSVEKVVVVLNQSFFILLFLLPLVGCSASACDKKDSIVEHSTDEIMIQHKINIKINSKAFFATLLDNNSAKAFMEMLPMTINMTDLNGNEKYFDLSKDLPGNPSNPGTIQSGDLMLFGSNTLVLFYESFSTTYSYTRLGRIDNPSGLAAALGSGNVTVTFELE